MTKTLIYQDILNREIKFLVHFTDVSNLDSIMNNGIQSINSLHNNNITFSNNDLLRLDNRPNSISLSISFPNYKMFSYYRIYQTVKKNMVVLLLDPALIRDKKCLFFSNNAASSEFYNISDNHLESFAAWNNIFELQNNGKNRKQLNIPNNYSTNPQAEVLCLEDIEPQYIKQIVYPTNDDYINWGNLYPNIFFYHSLSFIYDKEFYHRPRSDYKHWQ